MGDPLDIKIRGYHLSLRREEASAVEIAAAAAPIAGHFPLD
jgi:Fe2+ transport system protein FeoA